ncbi:TFIIB-type zinc ribbon-containing protein [Nocardioides luteus]|uniref:TFIIB-type zinc ribbon-containing protein n=1 Tax=Nocardioides luteus TaxID=1844 RepID=UPI0018C9B333|nr:zf-TFIIB domain-containing protein [Nocardioides luteus]MBG6097983.1 Zn-finger nucleic acid-binding protein [Nocardioides luteus]
MQCPIDGVTLVMSERQGIEIDYCPQCRGVWLDRGEIDKIIERSVGAPQLGSYQQQPRQEQRDERRYEKRDYERRDYDDDHRYDKRRSHHRESWLGDLFG